MRALLIVVVAVLTGAYLHAAAAQYEVIGTQVVFTIVAPSIAPCSVDVRDKATGLLVDDVNPALYTGAGVDTTRSSSVISGMARSIVVGKQFAPRALDGLRHSGALQGFHQYTYNLCSGTYTGEFTTMNPPVGITRNKPPLVDRTNPGQYAYPDIKWNDLSWSTIDPTTGFKISPLSTPRTGYSVNPGFSGLFLSGFGTNWSNPNTGALIDDTLVSAYTANLRDILSLELGVSFTGSATHGTGTPGTNSINIFLNAWGGAAAAVDRQLELAWSVDGGNTPATDWVVVDTPQCLSLPTCTIGNRFNAIAAPIPPMQDWFASSSGISKIDTTDLSKRNGFITRTGTVVTWTSGDVFCLKWKAGSKITLPSGTYVIASVDNEQQITLTTGTGSETGTYNASNAYLLIRKHTTSPDLVTVQFASYIYEVSAVLGVPSDGDEDQNNNCSGTLVAGPGGEMGWHCVFSQTIWWIGSVTGTRTRLGRLVTPYQPVDPSWNQGVCNGAYWDYNDANTLYCPKTIFNDVSSTMHAQDTVLLKLTLTPNGNADVGDLMDTTPLVQCGSAPCWTITNLTPTVSLNSLFQSSAQWVAVGYGRVNTDTIIMCGRSLSTNKLIFLARRGSRNDTMAFMFSYDPVATTLTGSVSSFNNGGSTWGTSHGPSNLNNTAYTYVPVHQTVGPYTPPEAVAGDGPYIMSPLTGALSGTPGPCPAQPGGNTLPNWPTGSHCSTVTMDGQPGDPSPASDTRGTVNITGTSVVGTGDSWKPGHDKRQFQLGPSPTITDPFYTFTLVDSTHGTLSSAPGNVIGSNYVIWLDPINNGAGVAKNSYLQNLKVGDLVCWSTVAAAGGQCFNSQYAPTGGEWSRVLTVAPSGPTNIVVLFERGYAGSFSYTATPAIASGAIATMEPSSCFFVVDSPCGEDIVYWNFISDPTGVATVSDPLFAGCCHGTRQNVLANFGPNATAIDGTTSWAYQARPAQPPALFTTPGFQVAMAATFHGKIGVGVPNAIDTHPTSSQFNATATEKQWISDARVYLGGDSSEPPLFCSQATPCANVSGTLYKATAAQVSKLNPRTMPTLASCGNNPLVNISGPASVIGGTSTDNYKYCVTNATNECVTGSTVGDVYVNCPFISHAYCPFHAINTETSDLRGICIADAGSAAMAQNQTSVIAADVNGRNMRRVTNGLSNYNWNATFWNVKNMPTGGAMATWTPWLGQLVNSMLYVTLPPFPGFDPQFQRNDYIKVPVVVPTIASVSTAQIKFGYDNQNYYCTTRQDPCIAVTSTLGTPEFYWASETYSRLACSGGCTITIPALSQHVLYYAIQLYDSGGTLIKTITSQPRAIP